MELPSNARGELWRRLAATIWPATSSSREGSLIHQQMGFKHQQIKWLGFGKSSPFMGQQFRLVNYDNLPRAMKF